MRDDKPIVTIYEARDGAWVVEIDTTFEPNNDDNLGGLRVYVNDDLVCEGRKYDPMDPVFLEK